jgi:hypothetical protein
VRRAVFPLIALLVSMLTILPVSLAMADDLRPLATGETLRGRFVQERFLKGFAAPLRTEGHFVLASGHGLIWSAESPFAITTVITPAGLNQDVQGTPGLRMTAAQLPFLSRLYAVLGGALAGDWKALNGLFVSERASLDPAVRDRWRMILVPVNVGDAAMPFSRITVTGDRFVGTVRLDKRDGDHDILTFLDQALETGALTEGETRLLDSSPP